MPSGLTRYQAEGHDHLITFSCYQRLPNLNSDHARSVFEQTLEKVRARHGFTIHAYVVMPEHVHLLLSEPTQRPLAIALNVLKTQSAKQLRGSLRQFWQTRYHDVNVFSADRWRNAVHYIHHNPVTRGLVQRPEDWLWSSYSHWLTGHPGHVTLGP